MNGEKTKNTKNKKREKRENTKENWLEDYYKTKSKGEKEKIKKSEDGNLITHEEWKNYYDDDEETEIETEFIPYCTRYIGEEGDCTEHECGDNCYCSLSEDEIFGKLREEAEGDEEDKGGDEKWDEEDEYDEIENKIVHAEVVGDSKGFEEYENGDDENDEETSYYHIRTENSGDDETYDDDEILPGKEEAMRRLKKIAKLIDILEFVDSCLIVGERFVRDDNEAKEVIKEIRDKILSAETVLTDYLITGKMPKIQ